MLGIIFALFISEVRSRSEGDAGGAAWGSPDPHRGSAHLVAKYVERLGHVARAVAWDGALTRRGRVGTAASRSCVLLLLLLLVLLFLVLRPEGLLYGAPGGVLSVVVLLLIVVLTVVIATKTEG